MALVTGPPTLAFHDVSMHFGGIQALKRLSFHINEGELFAIIGPNGAGKSTLFNCINGIYKPTQGRILFQGEDVTGLKPFQIAHRGIARTFQNIALFFAWFWQPSLEETVSRAGNLGGSSSEKHSGKS
jgi:branched-chain amino acid transport system ATP-binding protein